MNTASIGLHLSLAKQAQDEPGIYHEGIFYPAGFSKYRHTNEGAPEQYRPRFIDSNEAVRDPMGRLRAVGQETERLRDTRVENLRDQYGEDYGTMTPEMADVYARLGERGLEQDTLSDYVSLGGERAGRGYAGRQSNLENAVRIATGSGNNQTEGDRQLIQAARGLRGSEEAANREFVAGEYGQSREQVLANMQAGRLKWDPESGRLRRVQSREEALDDLYLSEKIKNMYNETDALSANRTPISMGQPAPPTALPATGLQVGVGGPTPSMTAPVPGATPQTVATRSSMYNGPRMPSMPGSFASSSGGLGRYSQHASPAFRAGLGSSLQTGRNLF